MTFCLNLTHELQIKSQQPLQFIKHSVKIRRMLVAKPSFFLQHRALVVLDCNNNNKTVSEI